MENDELYRRLYYKNESILEDCMSIRKKQEEKERDLKEVNDYTGETVGDTNLG